MSGLIRQASALAVSNLKSIRRRFWLSASAAFSVAMVVTVLLGFLAMSNGFSKALLTVGAPDIAIALTKGAASEFASQIEMAQIHQLDAAPGIARAQRGPVISPEILVPVDGHDRSSGLASSLSLRGIGGSGLEVRPGITLIEGRTFQPDSSEIIVGRRLRKDYIGLDVGDDARFGHSKWKVVGIFEADGSALESEILGDLTTVQTVFNRPNQIQSVRVRLSDEDALARFRSFTETNPLVDLSVRSEREYFASMAERTTNLILYFGWPLAIVMAAGAMIGTMTTMMSSIAERRKEIATVRVLGFSRSATFFGTWAEAMVTTMAGCVLGLAFSALVLNGWSASTVTSDQQHIGFELMLSPGLMLQAVILSILIGAIGGGLPAFNATRIPLTVALAGRD